MTLDIIGKNGLKLRQDARKYIEKKMTKFSRYLSEADGIKVEVRYEKTKSKQDSFIVQATIVMKGTLLRAEEKGNTIIEAADIVAEALERQIERYKTRHKKKAKGSATVRQPVTETGEAEESPAMPSLRVVKIKQFLIKRITVDEASRP
jgi:putative sigma-54 modulation protein